MSKENKLITAEYDLELDGDYLCTCVSNRIKGSKIKIDTYKHKNGSKLRKNTTDFCTVIKGSGYIDLSTYEEAVQLRDTLNFILEKK